ncbi:MAG: UbiD family decarboxylase [Phycisphaerales bacterium]|nr:UbiD family decarboxylase [Phycisphaerales bacterium]
MYTTLREFVDALASAGELARVRAEVSPVLEISAIADRESRRPAPNPPSPAARRDDPRFHHLGGRALLFEHVTGSDIPVLINSLGSYRRMELALGCDGQGFDAIGARIAELVKPQPPRSFTEAMEKARQFAPLLKIGPKRRRSGICQQVVRTGDEIDLTGLPLLRCWPHDGDYAALGYPSGVNDQIPGLGAGPEWDAGFRGRYVTFAGIHTIHADHADADKPPSHNIGMYRVQLLGKRLMAMHWQLHHDGARHWRSWKKAGKPMPVAIAFGGESVLPYAATCPLPPGISELLMAGFLHGRGIEMVRAKTVPLWVPANAEIVIEGFVSTECGDPGWDARAGAPLGPGGAYEGPFGDHTGFYSLPDRYGQLRATALTHRRDPILPATIVGMPPQEDYYIGKATERIMLPLLRTILPDIEDYDLPMFGAFHNAAAVRIEKEYPLHARRVMHGVWGAGQMSWTKSVFVVDGSVDVHDHLAVLRAMAERCDPVRDIERVRGPIDVLDHATPYCGAGTKLGFDCTPRWGAEAVGGAGAPGDGDGPAFVSGDDDQGVRLLTALRACGGVLDAKLPEELVGWLFVRADKDLAEDKPRLGREVLASVQRAVAEIDWTAVRPPAYTVIFGRGVDIADTDQALFHWVANFDAARDMEVWREGRFGMAAFDATPKGPGDERNGEPVRDWPPVLRMCQEVTARVESRWAEYGLA